MLNLHTDFDSPPFVQLHEEIWLSIFATACEAKIPNLIFTLAPETTVRPEFLPNALATIQRHHGEIIFVELTYPLDELMRRMGSESRAQCQKLTVITLFKQLHAAGVFSTAHMPGPSSPSAPVSIPQRNRPQPSRASSNSKALQQDRPIFNPKSKSEPSNPIRPPLPP